MNKRALFLRAASFLAAALYAATGVAGATEASGALSVDAGPVLDAASSLGVPAGSRVPVGLEVLVPRDGDVAGVESRGFLVHLIAHYNGDLASTGASVELTGAGAHTNAPPFPGSFGVGADADHFPGLVALMSTTTLGVGPGQNIANLFNIITVTNRKGSEQTDISATWIAGTIGAFAPAGQFTPTRLLLALVDGTAPNVVEDLDGNGSYDEQDLALMGFNVISNVRKIDFTINGF